MAESVALIVAAELGGLALYGVFSWLNKRAVGFWHRISRWWGGRAKREKIWSAYKEGRSIIMKKERDNESLRHYKLYVYISTVKCYT